MSKKKRKRYTNAQKRKASNMPHPEEKSLPIDPKLDERGVWISPMQIEPFPNKDEKRPPFIMKPKKTIVEAVKNGDKHEIKWFLKGDEPLASSDSCIVRNIMN